MRIGITGASGFIGSALAQKLIQEGHQVSAIVRDGEKIKDSRIEVIVGSLMDYRFVSQNICDLDFVFHMAADFGGVAYFHREQARPFILNGTMDLNVIRSCMTYDVPFFYPSSACAYPVGKPFLSEEDIDLPAEPDQMYGLEKYAMTKLSKHLGGLMRVGILHTIYGAGQEYKTDRAKFPAQMAYKFYRAKNYGEEVEVWGDGSQIRTFLHVSDAVDTILKVALHPEYDGPVNISSTLSYSVNQCVDLYRSIVNIRPTIRYIETMPSGNPIREANMSKCLKLYGLQEQVTLHKGFREIYQYIEKNENSSGT